MPKHGTPVVIASGETKEFNKSIITGFVCTASGTITINKIVEGVEIPVLDGLAVTAGDYVDLPFKLGNLRFNIVSAGAAGTLVVG